MGEVGRGEDLSRFTTTINTDNAAFEPVGLEVARILRDLTPKIQVFSIPQVKPYRCATSTAIWSAKLSSSRKR